MNQLFRKAIVDGNGDQPGAHDTEHHSNELDGVRGKNCDTIALAVAALVQAPRHGIGEVIQFAERATRFGELSIEANEGEPVTVSRRIDYLAEIACRSHATTSISAPKAGRATIVRWLVESCGNPRDAARAATICGSELRNVTAAKRSIRSAPTWESSPNSGGEGGGIGYRECEISVDGAETIEPLPRGSRIGAGDGQLDDPGDSIGMIEPVLSPDQFRRVMLAKVDAPGRE